MVAKAAQSINFAALDPVLDDEVPLALKATASSGLPVSHASSNTGVATLSGNMLTIAGPGTTTTWGMVDGLNTIALRVTDSVGKISTVSTTVEVVVNLAWDSNGTVALQTDGAGDWTTSNPWWNGSSNTSWTSGDDAVFGSGGTGGEVTLSNPTAVDSLTFNSFTGTYTLGTAGQTITLSSGITKNASGAGAAAIVSPVTLAAAQSWSNHSAGLLTIGPDTATNGDFLLTVAGTGNTAVSGAIGGAGGLTKTGTGILSLSGQNTYTSATQATTSLTFAAAGTLGLVMDSPVTAASAAVDFTGGTVSVIGTPSAPSHLLLTALSFTGTPVLASLVSGYELKIGGNQLQLNQILTDFYAVRFGDAPFVGDANNDGVANGMAWLLGAASPGTSISGLLPVGSLSKRDDLILTFSCLKAGLRGAAVLKVHYSKDLGVTDPWHEAIVPGDAGGTVNGVVFATSANENPDLIHVQATIPASAAALGERLFGRLVGDQAP